jgi:hypothetical protein
VEPRFTASDASNGIRDAHSFIQGDSLQNQAARQAIQQHRKRVFDTRCCPEIRIIGALWQVRADEISFDKLVGFFVSRFKKNPAITWKRDAVIVFPG